MEKHWATNDIILHSENIICKASHPDNQKFHNFVLLGVLFCCLDTYKRKAHTWFLRVEGTQKLDGDMTQNFSVFVCFQGCTFSLIASSQLLPCICIKGLHTSFHLPDNQKNNHFDCLQITKAPDTEFINPYPLPWSFLFYEMNSWIPSTTKILCASKTLAELFKMLFAGFCMKIMSKFLIFRILLTHS